MDEESRNPGLAAVFSFLLTGAGQVYAGSVLAGFVWWVIELALIAGGVYLYHTRYGWTWGRQGLLLAGVWTLLVLLDKFVAVQQAQSAAAAANKRRARARLREALRSERLAAREGQPSGRAGATVRPWVTIPTSAAGTVPMAANAGPVETAEQVSLAQAAATYEPERAAGADPGAGRNLGIGGARGMGAAANPEVGAESNREPNREPNRGAYSVASPPGANPDQGSATRQARGEGLVPPLPPPPRAGRWPRS